MYLCYMLLLQWLLVVAYPIGHLIAKIGDDHFPSEFALIGPPIHSSSMVHGSVPSMSVW